MSKTIIVPKNANMFYKVSKEGYKSVASNVIMDSDKVINVELNQLPIPVQLTVSIDNTFYMGVNLYFNIYENDVLIKTINLDDFVDTVVTENVNVTVGSTVKITSNYNYNWYITDHSTNIAFSPNMLNGFGDINLETEATITSSESMFVKFRLVGSEKA